MSVEVLLRVCGWKNNFLISIVVLYMYLINSDVGKSLLVKLWCISPYSAVYLLYLTTWNFSHTYYLLMALTGNMLIGKLTVKPPDHLLPSTTTRPLLLVTFSQVSVHGWNLRHSERCTLKIYVALLNETGNSPILLSAPQHFANAFLQFFVPTKRKLNPSKWRFVYTYQTALVAWVGFARLFFRSWANKKKRGLGLNSKVSGVL